MCGILVSNSKDVLLDNVEFIKSRGTVAWSLTTDNATINHNSSMSIEEAIKLCGEDGVINVIHVQSPTSITHHAHPAINKMNNTSLWHNGMIDSAYATEIGVGELWDTQYILNSVLSKGFEELNTFKGSFSCIYRNNKDFYFFRNRISPMFTGKNILMSVQRGGMIRTEPNIVFKINNEVELEQISNINNTFNPFGV